MALFPSTMHWDKSSDSEEAPLSIMDWKRKLEDACSSRGHNASDGSVNLSGPISLGHLSRPKTPANQYSGITAIPSTGFLTPSLHGSPAIHPMPFTPLSLSPAGPLQSSPLIQNYPHGVSSYQDILPNQSRPNGVLPTSAGEPSLGLMQYSNSANLYRPPQTPRPQPRPECVRGGITGLPTPINDGCGIVESRPQPLSSQQSVKRGPRVLLPTEAPSLPPGTNSSCVAVQTENTPESFYNSHYGTPSRPQELPGGSDRYEHSPLTQGTFTPSTMLLSPPTPVFSGTGGRRGFHPMQAISNDRPQQVAVSPSLSRHFGAAKKFSDQYHGMHTDSNASAEHLSPEQNCSLWLTNLPPNVDVHELLASVRNIGRVWCTYINEADHIRHHTAAAKLVFFTPDAAQRLLNASNTNGLLVRGYRVRVDHNRIKTEAHPNAGDASRVLIITGDPSFVNETALTEYFRCKFVFEIDQVQELIKAPHRAIIEYRFGSYRCQSQMGKMALEKDRPQGFEKVEFGEDPCEVGDTYSAYQVAATRIRGLGL